jgi:peptide/nickel transport system permease protein
MEKSEPIQKARGLFDKKTQEREEYLSVTQLMVRRFNKHLLARISLFGLIVLYLTAIIGDFVAPYGPNRRLTNFTNAPPTRVHFVDQEGNFTGPMVYQIEKTIDPQTFASTFVENFEQGYPVRLFTRGDSYSILGIINTNLHLFGIEARDTYLVLFGTDRVGRDIFSRVVLGARVSMFIGLVGVFISFVLGCIIGGISGYFGGVVDEVIQRIIDVFLCIPTIPLWIALSAAIPKEWSVVQTYFAITVVLAVVGWTGLARVVRGKLLSLRDLDFVVASRVSGGSDMFIIVAHLLPNFLSYLIVSITIAIPSMILAETALSFIGVGMQEPAVSWGVLLQETMNFTALVHYPWKLIPVIPVILVVLMFNAVGDGLRDAADPYSL